MIIVRLLTYPATFMMLIAGLYVWIQVAPGSRAETFAMLALTAVGATEVVNALAQLVRRDGSRSKGATHVLTGGGSLLMAYALLANSAHAPFIAGGLLFTAGMLLLQRETLRGGW